MSRDTTRKPTKSSFWYFEKRWFFHSENFLVSGETKSVKVNFLVFFTKITFLNTHFQSQIGKHPSLQNILKRVGASGKRYFLVKMLQKYTFTNTILLLWLLFCEQNNVFIGKHTAIHSFMSLELQVNVILTSSSGVLNLINFNILQYFRGLYPFK